MKLSKRQLRTYLLTVSRGAKRSPLFWWMVEHYEETAQAAAGKRMPWMALCRQFAAFGLTDGHGNPPSQEAARRTWRAVRTEMTKVQAAPQPPAPRQPQRSPPPRKQSLASAFPVETPRHQRPDAVPTIASMPGPGPPLPPPAGPTGPSGTTEAFSPEDQEKIDRLMQQFAQTDRKRFGS